MSQYLHSGAPAINVGCVDATGRPLHMTTTTKTHAARAREMAAEFLSEWDRHEWMHAHGKWASANFKTQRAEYAAALEAAIESAAVIADALDEAPSEDRVHERLDLDDALEAARCMVDQLERLRAASVALDGAAREDDNDYIAEGTIDPDGLRDECRSDQEIACASWNGWDCREGRIVYLLDDGRVVLNWWRSAYGARHERDLWLMVGTVDMGTDDDDSEGDDE